MECWGSLKDLPPTSVAGFVNLKKITKAIVADPGKYLLRFPFNLLPARWVLSTAAMKAIKLALEVGVNINDKEGRHKQAGETAIRRDRKAIGYECA